MGHLHFDTALLPTGWAKDVQLEMVGGRIGAVAAGIPAAPDDERHAVGLPGLASLHSHAFQRGMAGLAERRGNPADSFWTWRDTMYRFALAMTPEDVQAVALQLYCELLEGGFTRVGEFHYLHHDVDGAPYTNIAEMAERIAAAASLSGVGLTLLPSFYAHATFGGAAPHDGQRRFINGIEQFARLWQASAKALAGLPNAVIGVAPHSLRAVTPEELGAVIEMARQGPIHIHIAEQMKEVDDCIAWSGRRPVQWLLDTLPVDERWCCIHATHMTEAEVAGLARSGAVAGLCPLTEASLGDGVFSGAGFVAAGGRYGVGTDSNILIGAAEELAQLEYSQRLQVRQRNVMAANTGHSTGRSLFDAALTGGAQALGLAPSGLAKGALADIVTLDAAHPSLAGRAGDTIVDGWIFAAGRSAIDCVWAGGFKVVEGGRHHMRDRARQEFNRTIARLIAA